MVISRLILSRMGNIWDRSCRECQNTNFVFNKFLYLKNRAVYEIMWKNVVRVRQTTDDNIIQRMRFACWITKVTDTHSECVILIALPRQQWLREYASKLRYTYIACLVRKLKKQLRPKCSLPNLPNCMASQHRSYNFVFRHRESLNCNTLRWQIHKPLIRLYLWSKKKKNAFCEVHIFSSVTNYQRLKRLSDFYVIWYGSFHKNLSRKYEVRENWLGDSHTLFEVVNEFSPLLFVFIYRSEWNSV
jgi:hypothetical protein